MNTSGDEDKELQNLLTKYNSQLVEMEKGVIFYCNKCTIYVPRNHVVGHFHKNANHKEQKFKKKVITQLQEYLQAKGIINSDDVNQWKMEKIILSTSLPGIEVRTDCWSCNVCGTIVCNQSKAKQHVKKHTPKMIEDVILASITKVKGAQLLFSAFNKFFIRVNPATISSSGSFSSDTSTSWSKQALDALKLPLFDNQFVDDHDKGIFFAKSGWSEFIQGKDKSQFIKMAELPSKTKDFEYYSILRVVQSYFSERVNATIRGLSTLTRRHLNSE